VLKAGELWQKVLVLAFDNAILQFVSPVLSAVRTMAIHTNNHVPSMLRVLEDAFTAYAKSPDKCVRITNRSSTAAPHGLVFHSVVKATLQLLLPNWATDHGERLAAEGTRRRERAAVQQRDASLASVLQANVALAKKVNQLAQASNGGGGNGGRGGRGGSCRGVAPLSAETAAATAAVVTAVAVAVEAVAVAAVAVAAVAVAAEAVVVAAEAVAVAAVLAVAVAWL
jgi:hypothetical protein